MNDSEKLAKEACLLSIALWRADKYGPDNGDVSTYFNAFIRKLKDDEKAGVLAKNETILAFIILQIAGFSNTHALNRVDDLKSRMLITRRAIAKIPLPQPQKKLLLRMMDLAESKFLPGTSVSGSYFQIERALIPEFLLEFYESFLFYESDYTATVKKTESPQ